MQMGSCLDFQSGTEYLSEPGCLGVITMAADTRHFPCQLSWYRRILSGNGGMGGT